MTRTRNANDPETGAVIVALAPSAERALSLQALAKDFAGAAAEVESGGEMNVPTAGETWEAMAPERFTQLSGSQLSGSQLSGSKLSRDFAPTRIAPDSLDQAALDAAPTITGLGRALRVADGSGAEIILLDPAAAEALRVYVSVETLDPADPDVADLITG